MSHASFSNLYNENCLVLVTLVLSKKFSNIDKKYFPRMFKNTDEKLKKALAKLFALHTNARKT